MLNQKGIRIEPDTTPLNQLTLKTGQQVAAELGDRFLLRYMLSKQIRQFSGGTTSGQYVTPTPYSASDTVSFLALPGANLRRNYVLLLDPNQIPEIRGPRWVRLGRGIEYYLPGGFPKNAVVPPGWEIPVT